MKIYFSKENETMKKYGRAIAFLTCPKKVLANTQIKIFMSSSFYFKFQLILKIDFLQLKRATNTQVWLMNIIF